MHYLVWRAICAFLCIVVALQYLLLFYSNEEQVEAPRHHYHRPLPVQGVAKPDGWMFNHERDANNPALTNAQCDAAFADLYYEIDRSVTLWQERNHTITHEDTEITWRRDAAFRVLVHNNQVRILETRHTWEDKGYRQRTLAVLSQLHRAVLGSAAAGENIPTVEFAVTVDDQALIPNARNDTHTIWAFARRLIDGDQDRLWLIPDFNFWSSPQLSVGSFAEMQDVARTYDAYVEEKIPQIVWRGVKWTNEYVRGSLLNVTKGKQWADVREVDWKNQSTIMRMEDMCEYMFVTHTEGRSWSGRLKYLLNCDSVPVIHELDWTSHYYHLLVPEGPHQNYILVKKDFSDLEEKIKWYLQHPEESQQIVDNSVTTFRSRYTTPAAEACYWRRLLVGWSQVAFKPDPYETVVTGATKKERRLRGIAFEEFVHLEGNYPSKSD